MEEKFIGSTLSLAESKELKKQVEEELQIADPESLEAAQSILMENQNATEKNNET